MDLPAAARYTALNQALKASKYLHLFLRRWSMTKEIGDNISFKNLRAVRIWWLALIYLRKGTQFWAGSTKSRQIAVNNIMANHWKTNLPFKEQLKMWVGSNDPRIQGLSPDLYKLTTESIFMDILFSE